MPSQCISSLEPWRAQIVAWQEEGIQGTTIHAALVRRYGYTGSYSAVHRFLKQLPSVAAPEAPLRLRFKPGEAAQVDFGAGPAITDARTGETFKTWVFVMTLCWSRHQYAEVVRNQNIATWLACHRHAFEAFGGVVGRVIIDNPKCAITKACRYDPEVQRGYGDCAEGCLLLPPHLLGHEVLARPRLALVFELLHVVAEGVDEVVSELPVAQPGIAQQVQMGLLGFEAA